MLGKLLLRYPSQDVKDSAEEYLEDFERLALKYSLQSVEVALTAIRLKPEQQFFPKPNEVAAEIDRQRETAAQEVSKRRAAAELAQVEKWFWEWVDYQLEVTGMSEQEFLDTVKQPGFIGRKARSASAADEVFAT